MSREFLMASIDEGVAIQVALARVVHAMGVKEFAAKVRMASPNVQRALNPRHNPTQATINRLLRPFRLRLSLAATRDRSTSNQIESGRRLQYTAAAIQVLSYGVRPTIR